MDELYDELLRWSSANCHCGRPAAWHAREVYYTSVFGTRCFPAGAEPWQILLCAKYILLFFLSDDLTVDELNAFIAQLRAGTVSARTDLGSVYHSIRDELRRRGMPTGEFEETLLLVHEGLTEVQAIDLTSLSLPDYHVVRAKDVATGPLIASWKAVSRITLSPRAESLTESYELEGRAIRATYLVNDLASIEHEVGHLNGPPPIHLNYVLLHARDSVDFEASVDATVDLYNTEIEQLRQAMSTVAKLAPERGVADLISILLAIVEGNLDSHIVLATSRYAGGGHRLRDLKRLGANPAAGPPR